MKDVSILSLDNRGRIVIPHTVRKSLGLTTNSQLMLIADTEKKEIKITPLGLAKERKPIKFRITLDDSPGSLGKLATTFGNLGISLVYGEAVTIEKDKTAIWTVIGPSPENLSLEDVKNALIKEGGALEVEISPLE
ncbi:MAG: AbrB/MazE/SpoVT family DNA-binding domain-containing protein [Promethearchaeota archaeon]